MHISHIFFLRAFYRKKKKKFKGKEEISKSNRFMGVQSICLIAIGESEQKATVASTCSVIPCKILTNKTRHSAYFSNVLYSIAIDRCLHDKITKLQKYLNS